MIEAFVYSFFYTLGVISALATAAIATGAMLWWSWPKRQLPDRPEGR